MYGKNPVRKKERNKHGALQVAEIFWTIQGEGPFSGHPAAFVRLTGCNLQCSFCDTKWNDEYDPYLSPAQIMTKIRKVCKPHEDGSPRARKPLVVITGGEPMRQLQLPALVELITSVGLPVQIESNGTYWQDILHRPMVSLVVSPKTPSVNKKIAERCVYWKYPLQAHEIAEDGLPQNVARPPGRGYLNSNTIFVTPCEDVDPEKTKANVAQVTRSCMEFGYIAQLQIHKYLDIR